MTISLTIGNFDGFHRGHQAVIDAMPKDTGSRRIAITFSNHPKEVLTPHLTKPRLLTPEHKRTLMQAGGLDEVILIPFTKELGEQSPQAFIENVRATIPFDTLVLGSDATIGKNRSGTPEVMRALADKMGFHMLYVEDFLIDGVRPSSSLIRTLIEQGNFDNAATYLGRPYSLINDGKTVLALPPPGNYSVLIDNRPAHLSLTTQQSLPIGKEVTFQSQDQ